MTESPLSDSSSPRRFGRWVLLGAVLLPCLYLPTLWTRFDFIDDGNLVYPSGPMPVGERLQLVWDKIEANVQHLGPFRPVLWAHWEAEAELFDGDSFAWRSARLAWAMLAAAMLLWLMFELGIRPGAALVAAAIALWNPWRSEIWTSLTLSEGVAMPYALLALVCAIRANRSSRSWAWDLGGALCVLAALGCKNTFAALVPVQLLLRVSPDGQALWAGIRRHGWRAALLTLPLLLPIGHYIYFKLNWHPGQYETTFSVAQAVRMATTIKGAIGLDFLAPGLLAVVLVLAFQRMLGMVWRTYRGACLAGLGLLLCGFVVYLPMTGVAGRYSMPAVWGADLLIAALLSTLAEVPAVTWKRVAYGLTACGLVAVAAANLGKQTKFAARADVLWQTLEFVENQAPVGACVAWIHGPGLNCEEGIHFCWHMVRRHRTDLAVSLLDQNGKRMPRVELHPVNDPPTYTVTGTNEPPPGGPWRLVKEFHSFYWGRKRGYHCYLWTRDQ